MHFIRTDKKKPVQHTAIHFARAGAASVVLAGRDAKALDESKASILADAPSCHVLCVPTDITDPEAVAKLFQAAGKIDVLVNNAGSTGTMGPLAATDFQKWWMAHVCLLARFLRAQAHLKCVLTWVSMSNTCPAGHQHSRHVHGHL